MASQIEREAADRAEQFRIQHGLGVQPIGDLFSLIEQTTGHDVAVLEAKPDEHGLTMRDPVRGTIFIGVARTDHPMRQRSSLAHELAHVLFEDWSASEHLGTRSPEEVRADTFGRHFLLPCQGLQAFLGEPEHPRLVTLNKVVQRYLVSPAIAAIQLRDSGYIDQSTAESWMGIKSRSLASQFGWAEHYQSLRDASNRTRAPQGLIARAVHGYIEGVVSAQALASLRRMSMFELLVELDEAGITPRSSAAADMDASDFQSPDVDLSCFDEE